MNSPISIQITVEGHSFNIDPVAAFNLAIPLNFQDLSEPQDSANIDENRRAQPNAFHLPDAHAAPARAGDFVGDTRLGGSANCANIHLNPHGNGTHTECVGHVVDEPVAVGEMATQALIPAVVLSLQTERFADVEESYGGAHDPEDCVLTQQAMQAAWQALNEGSNHIGAMFCRAIILRTLPNADQKMARQYSGSNPPYPTGEAVTWLGEMGCEHLVLDIPSLDREVDQNRLPNHHLFFEIPLGEHSLQGAKPSAKTVTEMAFIPNELADGPGFLNLQIPRFSLDAAPSRPLFYKII